MENEVIISFENFGFKYTAQAEPTLYNINLKIHKGEKCLSQGLRAAENPPLLTV